MKKRKRHICVIERNPITVAMNMAKLMYYQQCGYSEKNIKRAARYMIKVSSYHVPAMNGVQNTTRTLEHKQKVSNEPTCSMVESWWESLFRNQDTADDAYARLMIYHGLAANPNFLKEGKKYE